MGVGKAVGGRKAKRSDVLWNIIMKIFFKMAFLIPHYHKSIHLCVFLRRLRRSET